MKILLTGASGFLGSALAIHWLEAGHQIALMVRPTSSLHRLRGFEAGYDIARCATDIEIKDFVLRTQPDAVVHTACAYGRYGESNLQLINANLHIGLVVMQAIHEINNPLTFINTGSALPSDVNPYSLSKYQFAQWGKIFATQSAGKLRFVNVLLQHMYGPGDDLSKFTSHVIHSCNRNEPVLKLTAGEQLRDLIYIDDVVSAYSTLLLQSEQLELIPDIELGSGKAPSIRTFVEIAHRLTKSSTNLQFGSLPYRFNEAMHCQANIEQMNKLGWKPMFNLESGLQKTIELEFK